MFNMFKKLTFYTLLLLILPIGLLLTHTQWQNDNAISANDYFWFLITQSGGNPWAILTSLVLFCLLLLLIRRLNWKLILITIIVSLGLTQGIKTGLKHFFAEPRPYVVAMFAGDPVSIQHFYHFSKPTRQQLVQDHQKQQPEWLVKHRMHEVGYSFPSGHTIFAATWLLLVVGLLHLGQTAQKSSQILQIITACWAIAVLYSRIKLGMHYPIDILFGIILAYIINLPLLLWLQKFTSTNYN
ncbi:hypothetical protein CEP49_01250 [Mergibacter septicus]|nr:hypothetical protein CEP49_01250 [Mergibacter septicus]